MRSQRDSIFKRVSDRFETPLGLEFLGKVLGVRSGKPTSAWSGGPPRMKSAAVTDGAGAPSAEDDRRCRREAW
jgi:hypothetical protein